MPLVPEAYPNYRGSWGDSLDIDVHREGGSGGGAKLPFSISIVPNPVFPETGDPFAVIGSGNLFLGPYAPSKLEPTNQKTAYESGLAIAEESIVYIRREHPSDVLTFEIGEYAEEWTPHEPEDWITSTEDPKPPLEAFYHPIAAILNNPDPPPNPSPAQEYIVRQMVTSHMALGNICFSGRSVKTFRPL